MKKTKFNVGDTGKPIDRKLLNDNGTDATLFDQSEETQDEIAKLLGVTF